jgi:hypothetical protein
MIDYNTIDLSTVARKDVLRMKKDNSSACTDLIMSFSDILSFGLVDEASTRKLPEGDAALVW